MIQWHTDWSVYDWCNECDAMPRKPCRDLRYGRDAGPFHRNRPHKGRDKLELE